MASETELERLVVRLVGDVSQYVTSLNKASSTTQIAADSIAKEMEKSTAAVSSSSAKSASIVDTAAKEMAASLKKGEAVTRSVESALDKYNRTVTDNSSLLKSGAITQDTYNRALDTAKGKLDASNKSTVDLAKTSQAATAAIATLAAGLGFWKSFDAFSQQEAAERRLSAALSSNGHNVQKVSEDYKAFAATIEKTTTTSDQAALGFLQQAETFGITGEAAKRATTNAIALADAQNKEAKETLRATVELERGKTTMLEEYFPALKDIEDSTKKVAKAQELLAKTIGVSSAKAQSSAGQIEQLRNSWSGFLEMVGATIAKGLNPVIAELKNLAEWFKELPSEVKTAIAVGLTFITLLGATGAAIAATSALMAAAGPAIAAYTAGLTKAGLAGAGLRIAIVALAVYGVKSLLELAAGTAKLNAALDESAKLTDKVQQLNAKNQAKALGLIGEISNPNRKIDEIKKQIDNATKNASGLEQQLSTAKKKLDTLTESRGKAVVRSLFPSVFGEAERTEFAEAKSAVDDLRKRIGDTAGFTDKLKSELSLAEGRTTTLEAKAAIDEMTKSLKLEAATIGMTSTQVDLYRIKLLGANDAALMAVKSQAAYVERLKEFGKVKSDIDTILAEAKDFALFGELDEDSAKIERIREQVRKLKADVAKAGPDDTAMRLERFAFPDKSDEEIARKAGETARRQAENAVQPFIDKLNEAEGMLVRKKDIEAHKKLVEEAAAVVEQLATPVEQYAKTVEQLNKLFGTGLISEKVFERGMEDAKKKLDDATNSAKDFNSELQKLDGALVGSAEAQARIEADFERRRHNLQANRNLTQKMLEAPVQKVTLELLRGTQSVDATTGYFVQMVEQLSSINKFLGASRPDRDIKNGIPLPSPQRIEVAPPPRAVASEVQKDDIDRKEMIALLSRMSGFLDSISKRDPLNVGITNIGGN